MRSPDGGTALTQIATRLDNWQRTSAQAMPYASVAALTLAVIGFHALLQFNVGLDALYILPIWMSVRLLGARSSIVTIVAISFILTFTHPQISGITVAGVIAGFGVRLVGFALVGVLISWFESSYSQARGLAYKDPLTGLLNRHALQEVKQRMLSRHRKESVVVVLDCDGFKGVNDKYGHKAGDHILQMLARILESETRTTDSLVRMGGDEFALVLESASQEEARVVLERVQVVFERYVADAGYDCSISFGIAEPSEQDNDFDEVLAKADAAMYDQKNLKKSASVR